MTIPEIFTQLAGLAGVPNYDYEKANNSLSTVHGHDWWVSEVIDDDMSYRLFCECEKGIIYDLSINISRH